MRVVGGRLDFLWSLFIVYFHVGASVPSSELYFTAARARCTAGRLFCGTKNSGNVLSRLFGSAVFHTDDAPVGDAAAIYDRRIVQCEVGCECFKSCACHAASPPRRQKKKKKNTWGKARWSVEESRGLKRSNVPIRNMFSFWRLLHVGLLTPRITGIPSDSAWLESFPVIRNVEKSPRNLHNILWKHHAIPDPRDLSKLVLYDSEKSKR